MAHNLRTDSTFREKGGKYSLTWGRHHQKLVGRVCPKELMNFGDCQVWARRTPGSPLGAIEIAGSFSPCTPLGAHRKGQRDPKEVSDVVQTWRKQTADTRRSTKLCYTLSPDLSYGTHISVYRGKVSKHCHLPGTGEDSLQLGDGNDTTATKTPLLRKGQQYLLDPTAAGGGWGELRRAQGQGEDLRLRFN